MAQTTTQQRTQPKVEQTIAEQAPAENLPAPRPRTAVFPIVPATWQEVTAIAGAICRAKMAPKSYCNQQGEPYPDKVAIAIMHGMEVGMPPMAALQSLAVINGMPGLYGDGMLAVVRASGLLEDFAEELEWDKDGPVKATCRVKRRGEPTWGVMECARYDAQKAGWWTKAGSWSLTPHRMLQMRARGWALRDKFADVLRGLHSAEEIQDMVDITPQAAASMGPAPAEPRRADYQQTADNITKSQPDAPAPQAVPAESGQPESSPGAGGDSKPEAASTPAPKAEPPKPKEKPATAAPKPEQPAEKSNVTDVEDQNAAEEMTFGDFKTARAFIEFSDAWLQEKGRSKAQADKWEEHYREKIKGMQQHEYQRIREAITDVLKLYHAVGKEQPQG
jgi:hypothetical protein